ncbi:MAG TPA: ester cyclase [Saprospiraceae bacterium]|nr:ester cyclase [Saprospiraceae bacterium]MCB9271949.1 ester cyclase [Lewinellaceae bacterium]HPG07639.1 ester cyclase [Saprospiraceae bacterium]HRV84907.1 ester cyclase [Saprospiraceae bacterium]
MKKSVLLLLLLTVTTLFYSCGSDTQHMDLEANREVVKKYHEVWSNGQVKDLDKILTTDFICHFVDGIEWIGIEGASSSITSHRKSFPDWNEEIVDMISEGDKVVTRFRSTGTQLGSFNGIDPTGKKATIYETAIYRVTNGKIAEQWGFPDVLSLNHQLESKN